MGLASWYCFTALRIARGHTERPRVIKKPLSLPAFRGVARDSSLPVGLSHALGKYDDADGNE
jgi:hypothetical protein